jgi:multidrug efflux pump
MVPVFFVSVQRFFVSRERKEAKEAEVYGPPAPVRPH